MLIVMLSCNMKHNASHKDENRILWRECGLEDKLPFDIFNTAITGLHKIDSLKKKELITIIDFSKPSSEKRLYVVDLKTKKLLFFTLVAHGRNSGDLCADLFSNEEGSLKSSLGFFITAETYTGGNGYSLRLDGLEKNINDNARNREIVIHGADYVSEEFIKKYGRLGRSWGCPALPPALSHEIIDTIAGGSCLFIYASDSFYIANSTFLTAEAGKLSGV